MDQAEALRQELARLRANAPFDSTDISALAATRVASVEGRPNATAREAWIRPAARLSGSVTTTDQPFWAKLPVVIGESSILALFGAILLTALYEAFLLNRDDADTEGDQDHFSDPYWPAKIASPTAADGMDSMDH